MKKYYSFSIIAIRLLLLVGSVACTYNWYVKIEPGNNDCGWGKYYLIIHTHAAAYTRMLWCYNIGASRIWWGKIHKFHPHEQGNFGHPLGRGLLEHMEPYFNRREFLCQAICVYPENPKGTQVIVGSMNIGYISDTARNRTYNLFRP